MQRLKFVESALCLCLMLASAAPARASAERPPALRNEHRLLLIAVPEAEQPTLRVVLPGHPTSDRSIEVLVPEHVTAVKHGSTAAEHLYLPRPGTPADRPAWRSVGQSLEYERQLPGSIDMIARATLEDDGVRFQYELTNRSEVTYDMITAVTDPRLTGMFHDVRLERTFVHRVKGFDLLASEVPARLSMPLGRWLPCRALASYTWPVPIQPVETRDDGITYYNKPRPVDVPLILTRSTDQEWVVASFSRAPGNVWSNPELTCQHVDPQSALAPGQHTTLEVKMLVMRGPLEDALQNAVRQRDALK